VGPDYAGCEQASPDRLAEPWISPSDFRGGRVTNDITESQKMRLQMLQEILRDYRNTSYRLIIAHTTLVGAVTYFV
jgi:hypothetical protein